MLLLVQSGFLSILYSIGSQPLQIWDKKCRNGHIKRITDNDIQSSVLEIMGTNVRCSDWHARFFRYAFFPFFLYVETRTNPDADLQTNTTGFDHLHLLS